MTQKPTPPLKAIFGLRNPGPDYEKTRHNAGGWFVEALAETLPNVQWQAFPKLKTQAAKVTLEGQPIWLAMPTTYMNESGQALQAFMKFYKINPNEILVAHDELDLLPGQTKLKYGGGHAGHNGLRDIFRAFGQNKDFLRLRIGIGHPGDKNKVTNFVLKAPGKQEQDAIETSIYEATRHIDKALAGDVEGFMREVH